jgi:hypothetical protein
MFYNAPDPAVPRRNRVKTWIIRALIAFILVWVLWIALISLLNQAKDIPKEEIERTLNETLNAQVTIGTLDAFSLHPRVAFEGRDVTIATKAPENKLMARIGRIRMGMDFKEALYYQGYFRDFDVADLTLYGQEFGLPDLTITQSKIKLGDKISRLSLLGRIGDKPVRIVLPLNKKSKDGKDSFRLANDAALTIVINGATLDGKVVRTENGIALQPVRVAGQNGVLSLTQSDGAGKPFDVVLALPELRAHQLTDPTQPLAVLLEALLPPPKAMQQIPEDLKDATFDIRISVEQWLVNGNKEGSVTLAWIYKSGHWVQPVIANHSLTPTGLEDVQKVLMDLASGTHSAPAPAAPAQGQAQDQKK